MQRASLHPQRFDPLGDKHSSLDRLPCGDDRRPLAVLEPALGGESGRNLTEELGLQLCEVRDSA